MLIVEDVKTWYVIEPGCFFKLRVPRQPDPKVAFQAPFLK
jgi:hypothetical protein